MAAYRAYTFRKHFSGIYLIFGSVVLIFLCSFRAVDSQCVKQNSCSCKGDKGYIDLSALKGSGGSPKFKDVPGTADIYSWNPCDPFTEGSGPTGGCTNVAVCQLVAQAGGGDPEAYPLGTQDSADFQAGTGGDDSIQLSYYAQDTNGATRTAIITLVCDQNQDPGDFQVIGEQPGLVYAMTFTSKYACYSSTPGPGPGGDSEGISAGSVLIIIAVVVIFLYVIVGMGIMFQVKGARGVEMVPNLEFWKSLPGLIKDGVMFVFRGFKPAKSYDSI